MGVESDRRCPRTSRQLNSRLLLALFTIVIWITGAPALAQDRERVLEWMAPAGAVDGYTVYLGQTSRNYNEMLDLSFVPAGGDGVTRTTLILDSNLDYYVAITARNAAGESDYSNEILIPASVCDPAGCDDADPCTADDCDASGCINTVVPDGTSCGAGGEVCQAGVCQVAPVASCETGGNCLQERKQQSCINVLSKTLQKVARTQAKVIAKCVSGKAGRDESADSCLALPSVAMGRILARTAPALERVCSDPPPDFGVTTAVDVNNAAVMSELGLLGDIFGSNLDGPLVTTAQDRYTAKCQKSVLKSAGRCQKTWLNEFRKCIVRGLKTGEIASVDALEACFGRDPKGRIARACDPNNGLLATRVLTRTCIDQGVDLSDAFPGCNSDDPGQVAANIDEMVECRVCQALNATHALSLFCSTCP